MLRRTIKVAVLAATIMGSVAVASPAVAGADVIVTPRSAYRFLQCIKGCNANLRLAIDPGTINAI